MYAVFADDVVLVAGVGEVVYLDVINYALADEAQAVLPQHYGVESALADEQFAFQILGLVDERGLGKALGIGGLGLHIALAIHHLIPLPVDHGATRNGYLEHIGVVGNERDGHKATVAPTVNTNPIGIHPGVRFEPLDTLHLVFHLGLATLAVDGFLVLGTVILSTAVVHHEDHITPLGHIHLPAAQVGAEGVVDHLAVGATIDVENGGVLLGRIEVDGIDQAVVVVVLAIGTLDRAEFDGGVVVLGGWVGSLKEGAGNLAVGRAEVYHAGNFQGRVVVEEPFAVGRKGAVVPTLGVGEAQGFATLDVYLAEVLLYGRKFKRVVVYRLGIVAEVEDVGIYIHQPAATPSLALGRALIEVEIPESVAHVGRVEEAVGILAEEVERIAGLYPTRVGVDAHLLYKLARSGAVAVEVYLLLGAVEHLDIDELAIGAPSDVGQVALLVEVGNLAPHGLAVGGVVYAKRNVLRGESVLGILDVYKRAGAGGDVEQGEVGHTANILLVESHAQAIGRGKNTFADAKLVAAHLATADNVGVALGGNGHLGALQLVVEVVALGEVAGQSLGSLLLGGRGCSLSVLGVEPLDVLARGAYRVDGFAFGIGAPSGVAPLGSELSAEDCVFHSEQFTLLRLGGSQRGQSHHNNK